MFSVNKVAGASLLVISLISVVHLSAQGNKTAKHSHELLSLSSAKFEDRKLATLKGKLQKYAATHNKTISIYLEELPRGEKLDINGDRFYAAASLFKLPMVMQLLKEQELGKFKLDDIYTLKQSDIDSRYGTLWQKKAGYQLTFRELAKHSIIQSDNTASLAISHYISTIEGTGDDALTVLDPEGKIELGSQEVRLSPKIYMRFLKCLYDACYVDRADSQYILGLMSQTEMSPLRAGTKKGTVVSDKFGSFNNPNKSVDFSDCGIVKSKAGDYSLCTMLTGSPNEVYQQQLDISKIVFEFYDSL